MPDQSYARAIEYGTKLLALQEQQSGEDGADPESRAADVIANVLCTLASTTGLEAVENALRRGRDFFNAEREDIGEEGI